MNWLVITYRTYEGKWLRRARLSQPGVGLLTCCRRGFQNQYVLMAKTGAWLGAFALVALLAAAGPAHATLQLAVGNPGLQHFDSDGGVELDFGLTDANGQPVGNLRVGNVKVFENGQAAKILDFRGQGQGRPVDIVFVMDITESMQPYIDAVKQNMITFAQDLQANHRDYRLGLVTFEDYVVSQASDCNCAYRDKLTSSVDEFTQWVGSLHAGGGGDIPEDQLDALAYAASLPFRPDAQGIIILITDAPDHHAGDGSANSQHDQAFWDHHKNGGDVTNRTASEVAALLKKNGLSLYAVAPPPFIAPDYHEIVTATHGRAYNIITEEGRFSELVREIGHSIATQYSLTYLTPRPIEDGTERHIELEVSYDGQSAVARTEYQVRGVGGGRIIEPTLGSAGAGSPASLGEVSFAWWNGLIPLLAIVGLLVLSRTGLGVPAEELKAIVTAQSQAPLRPPMPPPRAAGAPAQVRGPAAIRESAPVPPAVPPDSGHGARLVTVSPEGPIAAEYSLLKDDVGLGRGTENDLVIPHVSVSRNHARIARRNGTYQLTDLNSTNGTYLNNRPVQGWVTITPGSEVRLGDVSFVFRS